MAPSPTPSVTPSITPTPSNHCAFNFVLDVEYIVPSPTPSVTPSHTPAATPSITPSVTQTPSITPSPTRPTIPIGLHTADVYGSAADACLASPLGYLGCHLPPGNYPPANPMTLYKNSDNLPFAGDGYSYYYAKGTGMDEFALKINGSGLILEAVNCISISPTPSPTVTPSITPTPSQSVFGYTADRWTCSGGSCSSHTSGIHIYTSNSYTLNKYYWDGYSNYIYQPKTINTDYTSTNVSLNGPYDSCALACTASGA